jgi:hypothetical protein
MMKHKSILIILLIGIGISLSLPWIFIQSLEGNDISFETVTKGYYCAHCDKKDYVINIQYEWEELWEITFSTKYPPPDIPAIDFSINTIIAVYLGERATGGYAIEIVDIIETNSNIVVYVKETSPEPDSMVTMLLTQPYHIVKTTNLFPGLIAFVRV